VQLEVPRGGERSYSPSGLQTIDARDHTIGKIPGWRQIRQSLELRRNRYEFLGKIVLYHGFLT
jgi:hypothetical protein